MPIVFHGLNDYDLILIFYIGFFGATCGFDISDGPLFLPHLE